MLRDCVWWWHLQGVWGRLAGSVVGQTGLERVDTVMLHRCGSLNSVEEPVASTLFMATDPYHMSSVFDFELIILAGYEVVWVRYFHFLVTVEGLYMLRSTS